MMFYGNGSNFEYNDRKCDRVSSPIARLLLPFLDRSQVPLDLDIPTFFSHSVAHNPATGYLINLK